MTEVIKFEAKDWPYPDLEEPALNLARFIHNHRSFLEILTTFMRVSAPWWRNGVENSRFQEWVQGIIPNRKKAASDMLQFVDLMHEIKTACTTPDEWDKMRGIIPEKLFEIYFLRKHVKAAKEFGAQVLVYDQPVIYRYLDGQEQERTRKTVDAGSWDGERGEFVEVKFQPDAFQKKDIGYLECLEEKLEQHSIINTIFLVTFDNNTDFVRRMLESKDLLSKESKFLILSGEDITHNIQ